MSFLKTTAPAECWQGLSQVSTLMNILRCLCVVSQNQKNFADFASCDPASSIQDTEELNSHDSEGSGGDCSILMKEEGDAGWPSEALWKNLWVSTLTRV